MANSKRVALSDMKWDDFELTSIPDMSPPVPSMISNLLVGHIKNNPSKDMIATPDADKENFLVRKSVPRRIFSSDEVGTPNSRTYVDIFKRPNLPCESQSPSCTKRIKSVSHGELPLSDGMRNRNAMHISDEDASSEDDPSDVDMDKSWEMPSSSTKVFQKRSQSDSAVSIMKAVERRDSDSMLIGDATRRYVLPIISNGKHSDLKEISGDTLTRLMNDNYKDLVHSFEIIDCRYPYEYEGGHIRGAINLHTQKQIHDMYLQNKDAKSVESSLLPSKERHILVFHCEFSSQRAPDLCRFLRKADRHCNQHSFPSLHYPELYVLYGGYKAFFELHKEYCEPQQYLEMSDPHHVEDCRWHKSKSKTDLMCTKSSTVVAPKMQRKTNLKKFCL